MVRYLLLAAAALLIGTGAQAEEKAASRTPAKIRNPSAPLASLNAEELVPILSQMDLDYEGVTLPRGDKALLVRSPEGHRFQITPLSCDKEGRCRGVHFVTLFETGADRRTVAAFNERYAFVSAGVSRDDIAYLTRYEIADYGMPAGNFATSIDVFLKTAELFAEHLSDSPRGLKQAPDGSDLAAHSLNRQGLARAIPVAVKGGIAPPHSHAVAFEETLDIVETYVRAEAVYPGRIVNELGQ
ncbi:YbjN domain-containing protein [Parvularcula maris]|uniref:YbjN domain-containing protein n=1 Tax=Parvularcula maris TaxID=2965077 RepID=A0A9X2L9Y6_9PROT|nr:YbjN domain-containing protein [Parvularcula maris]MCQ8185811.1 YbjN domain-containing protein [Parvularcula maris]